jgi:oligoendopeptidase F
MAVVDLFQHWVYENPDQALDTGECDRAWSELWDRFMVGVDWSGLENEKATGWQRKLHIFQVPFYYIEYGLAQLGAVQVWNNSLSNQAKAVADYRKALSLGATVPLPDLYQAAGVNFSFDTLTLREACKLMTQTIEHLETI